MSLGLHHVTDVKLRLLHRGGGAAICHCILLNPCAIGEFCRLQLHVRGIMATIVPRPLEDQCPRLSVLGVPPTPLVPGWCWPGRAASSSCSRLRRAIPDWCRPSGGRWLRPMIPSRSWRRCRSSGWRRCRAWACSSGSTARCTLWPAVRLSSRMPPPVRSSIMATVC